MSTDRDGRAASALGWVARPLVVSALLTGLVLRLAFGLGYWVDKPLTHDEHEYLLLAENIAAGRGFQYLLPDGAAAPGEHFGRAPLYPLWLAGVMRLTGEGLGAAGSAPDGTRAPSPALVWAIKITQAGLGVLIVGLMAWLAQRAAGPAAAAIGAWLAALYPPLIWTPAYVLSETLYSALALGCVVLIENGVRTGTPMPRSGRVALGRPDAWRITAAGVLAGLAVLTRPAMLFFVGLAVPWMWRRRGVPAAGLLLLSTLLVVAPWTVRNLGEYGRFVLVASEGGITFWTGNHPLATGEGDMAANVAIKRANVAFRAAHPGLSPEQLEPLYYQDAIGWIVAHPFRFAQLLAQKAFYTVVPVGPSYQLHSPRYFWASVLAYLAVLPFGVLGLIRRAAPQPLLVLASASVLVCLVFFPQERFRIPVIDPTLLVCAASWGAARMGHAA
ncbi:MAG: hypothetical protein WCP29_09760 [Acidobacteriota bacterium]